MMRSVFLGLVNALVAIAIATSAFAYESPGVATGFVNDFAKLLTNEDIVALEETLELFKEKSGIEIAVVTIPTLQGEVIEEYANTLFREWGVGGQTTNRGLLILVARDERGVRIEVGYGLEGELPDASTSSLIRTVLVPQFKQGEYGMGLRDGVNVLIALLENDEVQSIARSESNPFLFLDVIGPILFFGYIFLSWTISIMSRTREWWLGGIFGFLVSGVIWIFFGSIVAYSAVVPLVVIGLCIDYVVSMGYKNALSKGSNPPWWTGGNMGSGGGFGGRSGGGGFGGFGGGSSGGGGASGRF